MPHNENSRVKIPALLHLTRLRYTYLSLRSSEFAELDKETNILKSLFKKQFLIINGMSEKSKDDLTTFEKEFQNIVLELGQDDLGKQFYNRLIGKGNSQYKLIDWENFSRNAFHICTELTYKNGEDEFRPDITVFVNGLPLSFIEVKKPNNPEWIKAERDRINDRFRNEKFRKFVNISQLLVFSNNMSYDDSEVEKLSGTFYATTIKPRNKNCKIIFNHFREEMKNELPELTILTDEIENEILKDNNLITLKYSPEFLTNKAETTPTNSMLTSLFSKDRLKMLLQFGLVYVEGTNEKTGEVELQKHIMRYPQFFATKAIEKKLDEGMKKGIIWHTQWSGKTALAFYATKYLTNYYSKKGIVPKFYFIVDRIDLLTQASQEFRKRGLVVTTVNSKEELTKNFRENTTKDGITVINIQKFNEDMTAFDDSGYDLQVQRVYFIDEAHRSYDPKGSSLANLYNSDEKSIKIALTGTPLILYKEREKADEEGEINLTNKADLKTTRNIFGDYIHKYYYNNSIKDGYTLKLLREEIETTYKDKMRKIVRDMEKELQVKLGTLDKRQLYAHKKFVDPMLDYILEDFHSSRVRFGDESIGAMVVCDSSEQAREMFAQLRSKNEELKNRWEVALRGALILHNEDDKETRKTHYTAFRKGEIDPLLQGKVDILFVYSMLLTGFDAPRLKKLYLWRKIKAHNLLQTLTRVNRPYKDFRVGYVVDFADISKEFDITNKAYFEELNREYDINSTGEKTDDVRGSLFMSKEEIDKEIQTFETILSDYSTDNLEIFSQQITEITDKQKIIDLKKALETAREMYNISRLLGHSEALENLNIKLISQLLTEVSNRLHLLNLQASMNEVDSQQLLNTAIEEIIFDFTKVGEEELKMLANDLQDIAHKTRNELANNRNQKDSERISLYEEFRNLLNKHNIDETNPSVQWNFETTELKSIYEKIHELNRKNSVLQVKFSGDKKYARIFKYLEWSGEISKNKTLYDIMFSAKSRIDQKVSQMEAVLGNRGYFQNLVGSEISGSFDADPNQSINAGMIERLRDYTVEEYLEEYSNF